MNLFSSRARTGLALTIALIMTACSSRPVPSTYLGTHRGIASFQVSGGDGTRAYLDGQYEKVRASVQDAISQTGTKPVNLLIVSGGTAWGTFGAAFLNATIGEARKTEEGRRQYPKFDVVTGVSTGCLIGLYAFLGESEDYAKVEKLYLDTADNPPLTERFGGVANLLIHRSVYSTAQLEAVLNEEINLGVLERLAAAHRDEHRRFLVGTVNADLGEFMVWDIGEIASVAFPGTSVKADLKTVEKSRQRIISILKASSSIPGILPPVYIDNYMHVDGGVRRNLFLFEFVIEPLREQKALAIMLSKPSYEQPLAAMPKDGVVQKQSVTIPDRSFIDRDRVGPRNNLYILISNEPTVYPALTPSGGITSVTRVLSPLLQERMNGNLDRIRLALGEYEDNGALFNLNVQYARASDPAFDNVPPSLVREMVCFDRPLIEAMAQAGRNAAASRDPWGHDWPDFVIRVNPKSNAPVPVQ